MESRRKRGFTLVETLVAITILTLSILAPFDAVERVINSSRLAKDQLVASSLAQEALEYVRFFRTSNYLTDRSSYDPMQGMDGNANRFNSSGSIDCSTHLCTIDGTQAQVGSVLGMCSGSTITTCNPLYVTSTGIYTQSGSGNTKTIFTRAFSYKQHTNYETVTVIVQWEDHGIQTLTLTENLYDWF